MNSTLPDLIYRVLFFALGLIVWLPGGKKLYAQCQDWYVSAQLVTGSTCAANGSFEVFVSGPDAANLSNIQFAVPATGSYAVPLNNATTFTSVPGGTWPVSAVAVCGGDFVGKNTTITMPGDYVPPTMRVSVNRNAISCGPHGRIRVDINNGRPPFTINLTNTPVGYTGPLSFNTTGINYTITDLPAGSYTIQVTDGCNSGTAPGSVNIRALNAGSPPISHTADGFGKNNCDLLYVPKPSIGTINDGWSGYPDTFYRIAAEIDGGVAPATGFEGWSGSFSFPLNPGMTIKDCYGKTVRYTIRPSCGPDFQTTRQIPYPSMTYKVDQNCNIDFKAILRFEGLICFPVTYTISGNGNTYGPFTTAVVTDTTPSLPIGAYSVSYTTADGYNGNGNFHTDPISGTPYSVSLYFRSAGIHNYADGFVFQTSLPATSSRTIELFSAPPGYAILNTGVWSGTVAYILDNYAQTPATIKFPPGNYVWKITDHCGTYLLPITVTQNDLYQFSIDIDSMQQTCEGLYVKPKGTAVHGGQQTGLEYLLFKDSPGNWLGVPLRVGVSNNAFIVKEPGKYFILPYIRPWQEIIMGGLSNLSYVPYSNIYTRSYSFTYDVHPLQADMDESQGFTCSGVPGQAEVHVQGKDGIPFAAGNYIYRLARSGDGLTGPYVADNTTGIFTGFGGNAGEFYEVKIEDSCGAFVVQPFEILDLRIARLIASSTYVACDSARVQLIALYLPGATYSWTGPNGFTSTQRTPVIEKISPSHIGVYRVSITLPQCSQPITDSTIITSNVKPIAPEVSLSCLPRPVIMRITNPQPGYDYKWEYTLVVGSWSRTYIEESDSNHTKLAEIGSFRAIAENRCGIFSDTVSIQTSTDYHPRLPADTLVCNEANNMRITVPRILQSVEWSTGATTHEVTIDRPGVYWVSGESPCGVLTDTIEVRFCAPQIHDILLPDQHICAGGCISLEAITGNHPQSYEWILPGAAPARSVEAAPGRVCYETAGTFPVTLTVTNAGGTATRSAEVTILPFPVVRFADTSLTVSYKSDIQLSACADAERADWYIGDSLICASCPVLDLQPMLWKQIYHCVVKNGDCMDTCTYEVMTKDIPSEVTIPSAFTPNGDGKNDYFRLVTTNPNIIIKEMAVYNRWGNKVYSGNDPKGWDGLHKGRPAEGGTYFWQIRYGLMNSDETWTRKGDVVLVR